MMQERCQFFRLPPPPNSFISFPARGRRWLTSNLERPEGPWLGPFLRNSCLLPFFLPLFLPIVGAGVENQPLTALAKFILKRDGAGGAREKKMHAFTLQGEEDFSGLFLFWGGFF